MNNTISLLQELINKCNCGVTVDAHCHKDRHQTVREFFKDLFGLGIVDPEDVPSEFIDKMEERDEIINIHFYPHNTVGFYSIYHYDLEEALKLALSVPDFAEDFKHESDFERYSKDFKHK